MCVASNWAVHKSNTGNQDINERYNDLLAAVIRQALLDYSSPKDKYRDDAISFLLGSWFGELCTIDPFYLMQQTDKGVNYNLYLNKLSEKAKKDLSDDAKDPNRGAKIFTQSYVKRFSNDRLTILEKV